jgi:hypothetical protein
MQLLINSIHDQKAMYVDDPELIALNMQNFQGILDSMNAQPRKPTCTVWSLDAFVFVYMPAIIEAEEETDGLMVIYDATIDFGEYFALDGEFEDIAHLLRTHQAMCLAGHTDKTPITFSLVEATFRLHDN